MGGKERKKLEALVRPGFGEEGTPVKLNVNHFPVKLDDSVIIYQYDVDFYPTNRPPPPEERNQEGAAKSPPAFNRMVLETFGKTYGDELSCRFAYDGRRNLYTAKELKQDLLRKFEFVISDDKGKREDITLMLKLTTIKKVSQLVHDRGDHTKVLPFETVSALDVVLREALVRDFVPIGRSLFSPKGKEQLGDGCSAWRGFYQSLRATERGFTLNIEQKFTAFYDEQSVVEFSMACLNQHEGNFQGTWDDRDRRVVLKALKNVKVRSKHTGRPMSHMIFDLTRDPASRIYFENERAGRSMSVAEYFDDTYQIRLKYPQLPCARVHKKRDIFIPLELLTIAAQKRVKALTPKQTQKIVRVAATKPQDRKRAITQHVASSQIRESPLLEDFGVSVGPDFMTVDGRILEAPSILYNDSRVVAAYGSWNMRNQRMLKSCPPLKNWGVLNFCSQRDVHDGALEAFMRKLVQVGRENGLHIVNDRPLIVRANPNRVEEEMKRLVDELERGGEGKVQIIMCIKFNQDTQVYNAIKRTGDVVLGIPTQCALAKHVQRKDMAYCSNILLKINSKLGGTNSFAEPYKKPELNNAFEAAPFMVIGADVTHPSPGGFSGASISAMVGSLDRQMSKFASSIRNQGARNEIIEDVKPMFLELIAEFEKANNGMKPKRLIIYRDGVSEGQFQQVLDHEVWELRRACMSLDKGYRPPMTFIIVQKRHNTRLYPMKSSDADRTGNVKPGTIVDKKITSPFNYDFFLCSHGGLQGTSKPSMYTVLLDENKFTVDQIQHWTYRMCYNYARCCKSVSVVTAAYYAHHLAFRGRCYVEDVDSDISSAGSKMPDRGEPPVKPLQVNPGLSSTLYYI